MERDVIWLYEQRRFAFLVSLHANYAVASYRPDGGEPFLVDIDEFELWEERAIEYDADDGC